MPKKPFIFNDESQKNSYGFSIPTKGISLKRFQKNPIMLDSHRNNTASVLGKWSEVKVDKGLLTGMPVFDSDDEAVSGIEGKVERGFISSCSMGITFKSEDLKYVAGTLVLEKCELYEVSIVAVPSNANSIRLYVDDSDQPLTDEEVQKLCLSVSETDGKPKPIVNTKKENMNKIKLNAATCKTLGFQEGQEVDASEVNAKVLALQVTLSATETKLTESKASLLAHETAAETAKLSAIEAEVATGMKNGQITADKKAEFTALGIANPALLTSTLALIPVKASLAAQVAGGAASGEVKTAEDFMKLSHDAQLKFKAENSAAYLSIFKNN